MGACFDRILSPVLALMVAFLFFVPTPVPRFCCLFVSSRVMFCRFFVVSACPCYVGRDEVVHGVLQHRGDRDHAGNAALRGLVPVLRLGATGAGKGALYLYHLTTVLSTTYISKTCPYVSTPYIFKTYPYVSTTYISKTYPRASATCTIHKVSKTYPTKVSVNIRYPMDRRRIHTCLQRIQERIRDVFICKTKRCLRRIHNVSTTYPRRIHVCPQRTQKVSKTYPRARSIHMCDVSTTY